MMVPRTELRRAIARELDSVQRWAKVRTLDPDLAWRHLSDLIGDREEAAVMACGGHVPNSYRYRAETTYLVVGVVGASAWVAASRSKASHVSYGRGPYIAETTWLKVSSHLPDKEVDSLARLLLARHGCRTPEGRIVCINRMGPKSWYVIEQYTSHLSTPYLSTPYALIRLPGGASSKGEIIYALSNALNTNYTTARKIIEGKISEEELAVLVLAL